MEEALRIIVIKSPGIMREAIKGISALRNGNLRQERYNWIVEQALCDPQANFTQEERAALMENIEVTENGQRSFMLRVRMTESERISLENSSRDNGMSMSEYTRTKIFA